MKNTGVQKFKMGSPFQAIALSYGFILLFGGPLIIYLTSTIGLYIGLVFMLIGIYIVFLRKEFWIDLEAQVFRQTSNVLGITFGKWQYINQYKGISIKYTVLTDKNKGNQPGLIVPINIFSMARWNPNQYNKDETWLVHIYSNKHDKSQILNTNKTDALRAIIYLLNISDNIKPYLANCRPEFELNKAHLSKGQLTLLNPKPIANRR